MEIFNRHGVGAMGERIVIMMPPREPMERDQALQLAAWIVSLADTTGGARFDEILQQVQNT